MTDTNKSNLIMVDRKKRTDAPGLIGENQWIYSLNGYEISIVQLLQFYDYAPWEIYQIKGKKDLFEDVERFVTFERASEKAKEYLSNTSEEM